MHAENIKLSVAYADTIGRALATLSESSAAKLFSPDTLRRALMLRSGKDLFSFLRGLQLPELQNVDVPSQSSAELDRMLASGTPPSTQDALQRLEAMRKRLQARSGSCAEDAGDGAMVGAAVGGLIGSLVGGSVGSMAGAAAGAVGGAVGGAINHAVGQKR